MSSAASMRRSGLLARWLVLLLWSGACADIVGSQTPPTLPPPKPLTLPPLPTLPPPPTAKPIVLPSGVGSPGPEDPRWQKGLDASSFWDCNGAACDLVRLQPKDMRQFRYAPQYAPRNATGGKYGEQLWMTGAASEALSKILGEDSTCCGRTDSGFGCGRCMLVRNPSARNAHWTAVVMQHSQSTAAALGGLRLDLAVPGFGPIEGSASQCGSRDRFFTYISENASRSCEGVVDCDCSQLPTNTVEEQLLRHGCEVFVAWGWTKPNPQLEFRPVECPQEMVFVGQTSFTDMGVHMATKTPSAVLLFGASLIIVIFTSLVCVNRSISKRSKTTRRLRGPHPEFLDKEEAAESSDETDQE